MALAQAPLELPPPPPDRGRRVRVIVYAFTVLAAAVFVAAGSPLNVVACLPFAALSYLLIRSRRVEVAGALAMAALDRAQRGRFDEARALLDAISPKVLSSHVGMMVDTQRAALALFEGNLDEAVAHATKGAREGKRLRLVGRIHQGSALSIRAVALAGLGRREEAMRDIAAVRAQKLRQGAFLARAALAEALLFARDRELDALSRLLREERSLLFGATGPRERTVVRALARLVAAKKVSVYREPAKREEQDLDENASWVARLAPEAASYARAPKLGARLEAPPVVQTETVAQAEKAAPKPRRATKTIAALWAVLVVLFLTIWQFLTPSAESHAPSDAAPMPSGVLAVFALVLAAAVGALVVRYSRANKLTYALGEAMELRHRGRTVEATKAFAELARSKVPLVAPQAERELASLASADGAFEEAYQHAERGLAAVHSSNVSLVLSRPVLLPQLIGEQAYALAGGGQGAQAERLLTTLSTQFPSYPYLAKDIFRARLLALAVSGRLDEAAAMARERPVDLPLTMQEELLCDALRVHAGDPLPEGERERIDLDLHDDGAPVKFLNRVAPALRTRAGERLRGPRVAGASQDAVVAADLQATAEEPDPAHELLRRAASTS